MISPENNKIEVAVTSCFPDYNHEIMPGVWAVAGDSPSPSDVTEILGINVDKGTSGVVLELGAYYGFFDAALWEKLNLWGRAQR
ncbi:MAG: hypothetical protein ACR2P7_03990 [bacterium]